MARGGEAAASQSAMWPPPRHAELAPASVTRAACGETVPGVPGQEGGGTRTGLAVVRPVSAAPQRVRRPAGGASAPGDPRASLLVRAAGTRGTVLPTCAECAWCRGLAGRRLWIGKPLRTAGPAIRNEA